MLSLSLLLPLLWKFAASRLPDHGSAQEMKTAMTRKLDTLVWKAFSRRRIVLAKLVSNQHQQAQLSERNAA